LHGSESNTSSPAASIDEDCSVRMYNMIPRGPRTIPTLSFGEIQPAAGYDCYDLDILEPVSTLTLVCFYPGHVSRCLRRPAVVISTSPVSYPIARGEGSKHIHLIGEVRLSMIAAMK
jgi:hypothetical protein